MQFTFEQYQQSADYLRSQIGTFTPKVLLILGSGLGYLANEVENPIAVPYGDIPHFMTSTAPGHAGRLVFGQLEGQDVAMMQGRFHHYEGYSFEEVTFAVRVLRLLGADTLFVTNAAGCVNVDWHAGELMVIEDHIKLILDSPLCGQLEGIWPPVPGQLLQLYSRPAEDRTPGGGRAGNPGAEGRLYVYARPPV